MAYIILLDHFVGPILKRLTEKKSSKLYDPPSPRQFGLFYAYLLGERMGTAAGERCRTEEPDGLFCTPPQVLMRRYSNLFTVYENGPNNL